MSNWSFHNPVKLNAGQGSLKQLPQWLCSGTWLLVTTNGFTCRGMTCQVQKLLPSINLVIYDQVTPNPELDDLEKLTSYYRGQGVQGILAIGGGSVLDAAKVLSVSIPSHLPRPLIQILREKQPQLWSKKIPLIAVPTTSGTGAEVTPFATVWDRTQHKKYSVTGDMIFPDRAILDPELTLSLPEIETLYTGLDAVSHAIESIWNINSNPISRGLALQALELTVNSLPQVLEDPFDLKARGAMQVASLLAGLAISQTRTAIAHSMSYPLTSHYGVPHGLACSFTLPALIDHYLDSNVNCPEKKLLRCVQGMLKSFQLDAHINKYVSRENICSLSGEMYHPDRVGNYAGLISAEVFKKIILSATESRLALVKNAGEDLG
ncbi:alcohol dehydrogenase [Stutzerimonas stutzeri]|uniref:Alcohol dehydrogenase n=1 Tax=Stutzerimonas stutzeri TaxID=316 RepID=A0A2S4ASV4_STUST|nr:phosphonoacetaldehyde reductase [Stutzerimonas stutzeri]MCQ4261246.1 phosphonoacetaldehyde reductase [Stutzerimonas stutzeri]POH84565.1 alcohol dehydrogenase [Stutzerimonas stutzeri]